MTYQEYQEERGVGLLGIWYALFDMIGIWYDYFSWYALMNHKVHTMLGKKLGRGAGMWAIIGKRKGIYYNIRNGKRQIIVDGLLWILWSFVGIFKISDPKKFYSYQISTSASADVESPASASPDVEKLISVASLPKTLIERFECALQIVNCALLYQANLNIYSRSGYYIVYKSCRNH